MAGSNKRGFASMDESRQRAIAKEGGNASGGQFKPGDKRASMAGKKGAQSRESKRSNESS